MHVIALPLFSIVVYHDVVNSFEALVEAPLRQKVGFVKPYLAQVLQEVLHLRLCKHTGVERGVLSGKPAYWPVQTVYLIFETANSAPYSVPFVEQLLDHMTCTARRLSRHGAYNRTVPAM